jgi:methionine-rich copper-binding protein CopC
MTRLLPALILMAAVSLPAMHLKVDKSSPAEGATVTTAPEQVRIWFTEAPTLAVSSVTLTGPSGKVELGKLALGKKNDALDKSVIAEIKDKLSPGKYVVAWKSSGHDGHILNGTFEFTLKTP